MKQIVSIKPETSKIYYVYNLCPDRSKFNGDFLEISRDFIHVGHVQKSGANVYFVVGFNKFSTKTSGEIELFDTYEEAYQSENW